MASTALRYASVEKEDIARELGVDFVRGLASREAEQRLKQYGPNALARRAAAWPKVLLRQFRSSFVYLLVGAGVLAFALGEPIDGGIILLFLAINISLGFYQEYHSEKTADLLNKYVSFNAKAIRDGAPYSEAGQRHRYCCGSRSARWR